MKCTLWKIVCILIKIWLLFTLIWRCDMIVIMFSWLYLIWNVMWLLLYLVDCIYSKLEIWCNVIVIMFGWLYIIWNMIWLLLCLVNYILFKMWCECCIRLIASHLKCDLQMKHFLQTSCTLYLKYKYKCDTSNAYFKSNQSYYAMFSNYENLLGTIAVFNSCYYYYFFFFLTLYFSYNSSRTWLSTPFVFALLTIYKARLQNYSHEESHAF